MDLLSSLLALQTPLHQVFLRLVEYPWPSLLLWSSCLVPFRVGCRKLCQVLLQILGLRPQNPILFSDFGSCNCWSLMIQTLMKRHRCRLCHTQRAFELTCSAFSSPKSRRVIWSWTEIATMGHVSFDHHEPFQLRPNVFSVCDSDLSRHFSICNRSAIALYSSSGTRMHVRMPGCTSSSCTNIENPQHAFLISPEADYYIVLVESATAARLRELQQSTPPKKQSFPLASYSSPPPAHDRSKHYSYPVSQHIHSTSSCSHSSYPISPDTLATSTLVPPPSSAPVVPSVSSSSLGNMPGRKVCNDEKHSHQCITCCLWSRGQVRQLVTE